MSQMFIVIVYSSSFAPRTQAFCSDGDSLTTCRINPAFALHITQGAGGDVQKNNENRASETKSERQSDSLEMYSVFDHKEVHHTGQSKPQRRCAHPTRNLTGQRKSKHCAFNKKLFRVVVFVVMFYKKIQLY